MLNFLYYLFYGDEKKKEPKQYKIYKIYDPYQTMLRDQVDISKPDFTKSNLLKLRFHISDKYENPTTNLYYRNSDEQKVNRKIIKLIENVNINKRYKKFGLKWTDNNSIYEDKIKKVFKLNGYVIESYIRKGPPTTLDTRGIYYQDYFGDYEKWIKKFSNMEYGKKIKWTVLNYAIACNNENCIKLLLERGANPLIEDEMNENSIDLAKYMGNEKILNMISDHIKYYKSQIDKNYILAKDFFDIKILYKNLNFKD
jgi:hypothetical protein